MKRFTLADLAKLAVVLTILLAAGASYAFGADQPAQWPQPPKDKYADWSAVLARVERGERVTLYVGVPVKNPEVGTQPVAVKEMGGEKPGAYRCYKDAKGKLMMQPLRSCDNPKCVCPDCGCNTPTTKCACGQVVQAPRYVQPAPAACNT
jgi:hypothetical protein